jgi:hypothetical protein
MEYARYERLWERLLDHLSGWATAEEIEPGHIAVSFEAAGGDLRSVTLVMTRDNWDGIVCVAYGDFDIAAGELQKWILALPTDHAYLVYNGQYELQASTTEVLAPSAHDLRLAELRREYPDAVPGGGWYASRPGES